MLGATKTTPGGHQGYSWWSGVSYCDIETELKALYMRQAPELSL